MIRVLVVDDHPVVRRGLRSFLGTVADLEVVGEAGDGSEALRTAAVTRPDVVLLDLELPDVEGSELIEGFTRWNPEVRVLVLTGFSSREKVLPAIRAGAHGYLLKDADPDELAVAIRRVAAGQAAFAPEAAAAMADAVAGRHPAHPELERLTPREREVLAALGRGWSNARLAEELYVSEKTVKTHVSSILGKLGLSDRTQAALFAVRAGLVADRGGR